MGQPLTDEQFNYLLDFVGYGTLDADIWYLGMEEAGGGEENIRARLNFRTVEDCAHAHKLLGITKHHAGKRVIQPTWRGMCYIMLRLHGEEPTPYNIRNYQAEKLGRFGGTTLLTELMPIPKANMSTWGYEELIPQLSSREEYYRLIKPRRIKRLRALVRENQPKVVIGYGKGYWAEYQTLFEGIRFLPTSEFEVAFDGATLVILTGHFTARSMNGKLDEIVSIHSDAQTYPHREESGIESVANT